MLLRYLTMEETFITTGIFLILFAIVMIFVCNWVLNRKNKTDINYVDDDEEED